MQENAHNAFMAQAAAQQAQHFQQQNLQGFNMQRNGNAQAPQAMQGGGMPGQRNRGDQDPNQDRDRSRREQERQKQAGNKSGARTAEGKGEENQADDQQ